MNCFIQNSVINNIDSFQIYENYDQSYPSTHLCKIKLNDGCKTKKHLGGPEIYLLIQVIAKEKITFKRSQDPDTLCWAPQNIDTFNCYEHDWKYFLSEKY